MLRHASQSARFWNCLADCCENPARIDRDMAFWLPESVDAQADDD